MTRKMTLAAAGALGGVALLVAAAVALGSSADVSAGEPSPPPGMHKACERMAPQAMERMHEGMMNAGGQMGEWMASGEHCPE